MDAGWHLIQFTTNSRRKEPRNIGVAAEVRGQWVLKLFAVDDSGQIDGRALRRFGLTKDSYADWVEYYTHMLTVEGNPDQVIRSQQRRPGEFRLIPGGHTTSDATAVEFADQLFRELVVTDEPTASEPWARLLKQRVETVLRVAQVEPQPDVEVFASWGDDPAAGDLDAVKFDYQVNGDRTHLMDRLQLHRVNVDTSKSIAREFNARVTAARAAGAASSFIAFYSGEAVDAMSSDSMLTPVFKVAKIVDVDNTRQAVEDIHRFLRSA
ncbi:hypothetical protein ATK86_5490 [Nocardia fluminea]|uniref:Uncharacterized protein n=1 Tax=Nocardia fluminea TaxID=134984 RepID=A0A2N3VHF5_9NOCA|nr:hypothetical protein ATK86_5490 [Nocardia fluminea]